jgi:hypothetical protein
MGFASIRTEILEIEHILAKCTLKIYKSRLSLKGSINLRWESIKPGYLYEVTINLVKITAVIYLPPCRV